MLLSKRVMGDKEQRRQSFVSRRFLAGLVASASMLLTGCTATSGDEPSRGAAQAGYPQSERNLTRIAPEQRKLLPEISGPALGAESTLSSRDYPGKVVVINVWGSWCAPCRSEAPELQAASEQTKESAQFLGITSKDYDPAPALAFTRAFSITYPSIFDPTGRVLLDFASVLPPSAIPSTMIIDSDGRLAARVLGPISTTTLVNMITDVANGR
jgi:thiol-disulfide isomerase/thioredoxin